METSSTSDSSTRASSTAGASVRSSISVISGMRSSGCEVVREMRGTLVAPGATGKRGVAGRPGGGGADEDGPVTETTVDLRAATRARIEQAALALFLRDGFEQVTIDD